MAFVPKDGTGRIFDRKIDKVGEREPDYAGNCNIGGQVFRIAAWFNPPSERSRVGSFSLRFKDQAEYELEKRNRAQDDGKKQAGSTPAKQHDFDSDIPF